MKTETLLQLGFKKVTQDTYEWYVKKHKKHRFITNDNDSRTKPNEWHIGYDGPETGVDTFWFNGNLKTEKQFQVVFELLTEEKLINTI